MPRRSDDPPRTGSRVAAGHDAPLAASRAAAAALEVQGDEPLTHESFLAVFSSHQRGGVWEPADEIQVRAVFGQVTLDFTRAELPPGGMVEVAALAICGEVEIIVPDGAEIELDGMPILGSIEHQVRRRGAGEQIRQWVTGDRAGDPRARRLGEERPYFRIDGRAIFGSIKVTGR